MVKFNDTRDIYSSAKERIKHHRISLYSTHPFFYFLLSDVPLIMDASCPSMGVGFDEKRKKFTLHANEEFVNDLTDTALVAILQHEALHLAMMHIERMDGLPHKKLWNIAADYKVNHAIPAIASNYSEIEAARDEFYNNPMVIDFIRLNKELQVKVEAGIITPEDAQAKSDEVYKRDIKPLEDKAKERHFAAFLITIPSLVKSYPKAGIRGYDALAKIHDPDEITSEEVYAILIQNLDQSKSRFGDDDNDGACGEGKESNREQSSHGRWKPYSQMTEEERQIAKQHVKQAAKQAQKAGLNPGHLSGELRRIVEELLKVKKDWRGQLSIFAQNAKKPDPLKTWKKFSRRYKSRSPGHVKDYRPNLAVIIDTSGSIDDELYLKFWGHIGKIAEICESLWVLDCDTRVNFCKKYHHKERPIPQAGGGGTDMQPAFDHIKRELVEKGENIDGIINLTDGYFGGTPDTHGIRTIFAISPGGQHVAPEKHRNVDIDD